MISEISITPQVFDPDVQTAPDRWRDQLHELARRLIPPHDLQPLVVADLFDGSWFQELQNSVRAIPEKNHVARVTAQHILNAISHLVVRRSVHLDDYPQDEDGWVREAVDSHRRHSLDLLVSTDRCFDREKGALPGFLHSLSAATARENCWTAVRSHCSAPMNLGAQREILRPLCSRFSYVALINPYLASSEYDFTKMVVDLASQHGGKGVASPAGQVDLHAEYDRDAVPPDRIAAGLRHRLNLSATRRGRVRLFFWERFKNRRLLLGEPVNAGAAGSQFKPIKGVTLEHVARGHDDEDVEPAAWRLLDRKELGGCYGRFYGEFRPMHGPFDL